MIFLMMNLCCLEDNNWLLETSNSSSLFDIAALVIINIDFNSRNLDFILALMAPLCPSWADWQMWGYLITFNYECAPKDYWQPRHYFLLIVAQSCFGYFASFFDVSFTDTFVIACIEIIRITNIIKIEEIINIVHREQTDF